MIYYHIVASQNKNGVIGTNEKLFCECKDDLKRFYQITTATYPEGDTNILIMGYKTWLSIPESVRPFKKRVSVIVSQNHVVEPGDKVVQATSLQKAFHFCSHNTTGRVFVIGGESIFQQCVNEYRQYCQNLYITHFYDTASPYYTGYHYLPKELLKNTVKHYQSPKMYSECVLNLPFGTRPCQIQQHLIIHQNPTYINNGENQYLQVLEKVKHHGQRIQSRNSLVYSLFGERMVFDLEEGFPLLTTKKMGYKTILRELLWFIKGSTSNQELQDKRVHIWDQNASKEFLESRNLPYEEGDLGPIYGFQWRHAGAEYKGCHENYGGQGYDQLQQVIHLLKTDPHSRRILMSAWNPTDLDKMALPPCHVMCQFYVDSSNRLENRLDCQLYQRSGDMFLGVPFNIASYAFLTHIIAKLTGYKPGRLIHILGDAHIYETHLEQVTTQLERVPVRFPEIFLHESLQNVDEITEDMIEITGYQSYPKIEGAMVA